MSTAPIPAAPTGAADPDQRVILGGIDWWQFETFLAIRRFLDCETQTEALRTMRAALRE